MLESFKHVNQTFVNLFRENLRKHLAQQAPEPTAAKGGEQRAEPQENPNRGPHERALSLVMHKEHQAHRKREQRNKEQPVKTVKESRRKPSAHGILATLHADVVNLLGIATHIARHKVVEEKSHVIKLEQMSITKLHVLLFKQKFPLQARCKVRKAKTQKCNNQRPNAMRTEQRVQVIDAPVRRHHDVSVHKVGRHRSHDQLQTKNQRRFKSAIHFTHFLPPLVAL